MKREPEDWPLAVVFDLDGTLIDSAADIAYALNRALELRKLPPFSVEEVTEMIGGGVPKLVERAVMAHGVTDVELLPLAADFIQYYRDNLTVRTTLYDGAVEVLAQLKGEGRRLGLCTNKQHDLTVETLNQLGIAKYFSAVSGERTGHPRKPDAAPLLGVLETLEALPGNAVMVGDSPADVGCARAARVPSVVVDFGYSSTAAEALDADAVIASLRDLPECLTILQGQRRLRGVAAL
jgi:phosphoglycolate phosphatase